MFCAGPCYLKRILTLAFAQGAGLGIDVIMKEAYGRSTASCGDLWGNASIPIDNRCEGGWTATNPALLRSHPMLFAPTQNMPSPGALGAARKVRSHAYAGIISEGTIANNFYVYNNFQHELWQQNAMVQQFSNVGVISGVMTCMVMKNSNFIRVVKASNCSICGDSPPQC